MAELCTPTIKICGLSDVQSPQAAIRAGATGIGFIMAPSRRRIEPASVRGILSRLPESTSSSVGVVVNESAEAISRIVEGTGVNVIQLAGDEQPDILDVIRVRTWKALRFPSGTSLDEASKVAESWLEHPRGVEAILLDASVPGIYGGSGHLADWDLAAALAERYPLILAGGLTPENVATAIAAVRPMGVDVSSGVESHGAKDPARITAFIEAAWTAFEALGFTRLPR